MRLELAYVRAIEILEADDHLRASCLFDVILDLLGVDELVEMPSDLMERARCLTCGNQCDGVGLIPTGGKGANPMAQAEFSYTGEAHPLPGGRTLVRGTRTSGGGRSKKHVFIELECLPEEVSAVQNALAILLHRDGRINATCF